jgi:hypothetical protein
VITSDSSIVNLLYVSATDNFITLAGFLYFKRQLTDSDQDPAIRGRGLPTVEGQLSCRYVDRQLIGMYCMGRCLIVGGLFVKQETVLERQMLCFDSISYEQASAKLQGAVFRHQIIIDGNRSLVIRAISLGVHDNYHLSTNC